MKYIAPEGIFRATCSRLLLAYSRLDSRSSIAEIFRIATHIADSRLVNAEIAVPRRHGRLHGTARISGCCHRTLIEAQSRPQARPCILASPFIGWILLIIYSARIEKQISDVQEQSDKKREQVSYSNGNPW